MKKISGLLLFLGVILYFLSCSASKEIRKNENIIDGSWQLQTVTTEGVTGKIKAKLLNEADLTCFVGSTWKFNRNNNLGSYDINKNGNECVSTKRDIRWSLYQADGEPPLFQFKKLDNKLNPIDEGNAGYRFSILEMNKNNMRLRNDVSFEGKEVSFIYNFVRI
jgi:hypothetical protein